MSSRLQCCVAAAILLIPASAGAGLIDFHVDADSPALPGEADGRSWPTAYPTLQQALAVAQGGDEVWVAAGSYAPSDTPGDRSASFVIPDGVQVYGGFSGVETARDERDPVQNETILHGDIDGDDAPFGTEDRLNNSYHVITVENTFSGYTVLDGFTVSSGYSDANHISGSGVYARSTDADKSALLTITNCTFRENDAKTGGAICAEDCLLTVLDCTFTNNTSNGFGAAIYVEPDRNQKRTAELLVEGCSFKENGPNYALAANHANVQLLASTFADNEGGAVAALDEVALTAENCVVTRNGQGIWGTLYVGYQSSATITHCSLAHNATGEIAVESDSPVESILELQNAIVWNETAAALDIRDGNPVITVTNTIISGGYAGTGNLDSDPRFRLVDPPLRPSWDSPAIDAGANAGLAEDILGDLRPQNAAPDMGAYEFGEDTDGGGLPDTYEDDNQLLADDPSDDDDDSDGDGLGNREEFRRCTSPQDNTDPPSEYYVGPTGSDETGDGSQANPWEHIAYALQAMPEGALTFPITLHVAAGTYEETVTLRPHVQLLGESAATTTIQYFNVGDDEHVVVRGAEGASIQQCTVTIPDTVTAIVELVRIEDVSVEVIDVILDGQSSQNVFTVFVTGTGSSSSVIRDSTLQKAGYGVWAVDSAVNVTRNYFDDIFEVGIFIRPPEGKQGEEAHTPLLGDSGEMATTGFNRFRMSRGVFVDNGSASTALAEFNDWGVYTEEEIGGRVLNSPGDVDYLPFFGKTMEPNSLSVELMDAETRTRIGNQHRPVVSLEGTSVNREVASNLYVFSNLTPGGTYTCTADANKYGAVQETIPLAQNFSTHVFYLPQAPWEPDLDPAPTGCFGKSGSMEDTEPAPDAGGALLMAIALGMPLWASRRLRRDRGNRSD